MIQRQNQVKYHRIRVGIDQKPYMGLGDQICKFLEEPPDLGGRPIFGLYRGNFGLFSPRNPPPANFSGPCMPETVNLHVR